MADKHLLIEPEIKNVPETSGVYKIHCASTFPRLSGKATDVVYIGRAKNLKDRLMTFPKGFKKLSKGQIYKKRKAVGRFWKLKQAGFELSFSYQRCLNRKVKEKELEEFNTYERKHLELPPLNRSAS